MSIGKIFELNRTTRSKYNVFEVLLFMKSIIDKLHPAARLIFTLGGLATAGILAASCVLYFGAGSLFEYYPAIELSELLLTASRSTGVIVCICAIGAEYRSKHTENEDG